MIAQFWGKRWGLSSGQLNRLAQILALAITVLVYSVMAMAVANSLFVSHVGAGNLPLAFILIGLCSMPAYALFSQIIDRYSRPRLFRYMLVLAIAMSGGLRLFLSLDLVPIYYLLLITIFFQWDFHNNILYASLLTDYFTTLEYKQYAPFIGIAQAVGTLLGGGLTILLSHFLPSRDLLLCLPVFLAIAWIQLFYLENSQRRLETSGTESQVGIIESLKALPDLVKRYPLVLFLASSSFLLVIIYISSEFLWFNIYGQHFNESDLTGFLGLMRIVISLVQVVFLYGITRPLLQWLGVARLNPVYPLTTLVSFLGLLFNFNLPAAIGLHLNGDALYKSINLPVHQLNYNGIPHEFIGRVRALSDGLIYSLGLTIAGVVLWICHIYLNLVQITWLAAGLTLVLLMVRLPMGKFYAQSLEEMIRSDTINLDDFSDEKIQLPAQSQTIIREILTNGDRYMQIKGLELAASLGNPSQFLAEAIALLPNADNQLRHGVLKLFSTVNDGETLQQFVKLLKDEHPIVRTTALEVLIVNQYPLEAGQLRWLIQDRDAEVSTLSLLAALQIKNTDKPEIKTISQKFWQTKLDNKTAKAIARVVTYSNNREFIAPIDYMLSQASPDIKRAGLEALTTLAVPQDRNLSKIAAAEINHPEPLVRMAAFKLLEITRCPSMLDKIGASLGDRHPRVRQQVANTLAAYGKSGLNLAKNSLASSNTAVVETAIAAIGQVRSKQASDILFKYLTPEFQQIARTRKWQQQIPQQDSSWHPLAIAIEDYHQRLLQKVLYILSCLGHSRTVNIVTRILATSDRRDLANAVEVLASLSNRRFILPLMPLLEKVVKSEQPENHIEPTPQWLRSKGYKLLLEALEAKDRWIRTGASIALAVVPSALLKDPDPIVRSIAGEIFLPTHQLISFTSTSMNRLLLLKNVPLFKNLSLDELFPIDKALEQKQILAGESIYTEGSWGSHLYIIAEGRIQIVKQLDGEQQEIKQLTKGQYFGEIALFDDAPRWDGAIALEDSILLGLEKKRFISLIAQRPHIILEICRFLSQRLRETDKYLSAKKGLEIRD